ncbi:MAG: hypothetical protein V1743_08390 [Nanoarchaeota archaeon]
MAIRIGKTNRAQAALEFLTTYGWAFMIVLVMIGALSYFGVLDPSKLLPEKCVFGSGIGCTDYGAIAGASGSIHARLTNGFGYTIVIDSVAVDVSGLGGVPAPTPCAAGGVNPNWCNLTYGTNGAEWHADAQKELVINIPNLGGKPKVDVDITYKRAGSTYSKKVSGVIQVKPT